MFKAIIHFAHWIDNNRLMFPRQVEIYNVHAGIPQNKDSFNILNLSNEPEPTRMSNEKVMQVAAHYNLILTWDEYLLANCSNAKKFYCGMTWIREADIPEVLANKRFEVTTFCTSKNLTNNHRTRHKLWFRQNDIKIPKVFWNSSHCPMQNVDNNPMLGANPYEKVSMFYAQYHIAIENVCHKNYFSEKLMDCFMTETLPIYIGCLNISDFFNTKGILLGYNEDDIIELCNSLYPDFYKDRVEYIKENRQLCNQYCRDFTDRIYDAIRECL